VNAAAAVIQAAASRELARAARSEVDGDMGSSISAPEYAAVQEAAPDLVTATQAVAEGAEAAASALSEMSTRLLPASGNVVDGDHAEAILAAAERCVRESAAVSNAAGACERIAEEAAEALHALSGSVGDKAELSAEVAPLVLDLFSSAAQRCREATSEVVQAALTAARTAGSALSAINASGARRRNRAHTRPPCSARQSTSREEGEEGTGAAGKAADPKAQPRAEQAEGSTAGAWHTGAAPGSGSPDTGDARTGRSRSSTKARPQSGGARSARSCSAGARGRSEALVQRRLQLYEEMARLSREVHGLQGELRGALALCPLLLPAATAGQRARVFAAVGEILHEALGDLRAAALAGSASPLEGLSPAAALLAAQELLPWLSAAGGQEAVMCDARIGALRLAALLDVQALASVLTEQFLPSLLAVRPSAEEEAFRGAVEQSLKSLRAWAAGQKYSAS